MDQQIAGSREASRVWIIDCAVWIAIHIVAALQILTFAGKLDLEPVVLSSALFIALSIGMYPASQRWRKVPSRKGALVAAVIMLVLINFVLFAKPFDDATNFTLVKIGIISLLIVIGFSRIRARHKEHGLYGPVIWSALGIACYSFAIICVFETDTFTQLPLILQSNLPTFLEYPYVTLALLITGAGATFTSKVLEARVRHQREI